METVSRIGFKPANVSDEAESILQAAGMSKAEFSAGNSSSEGAGDIQPDEDAEAEVGTSKRGDTIDGRSLAYVFAELSMYVRSRYLEVTGFEGNYAVSPGPCLMTKRDYDEGPGSERASLSHLLRPIVLAWLNDPLALDISGYSDVLTLLQRKQESLLYLLVIENHQRWRFTKVYQELKFATFEASAKDLARPKCMFILPNSYMTVCYLST